MMDAKPARSEPCLVDGRANRVARLLRHRGAHPGDRLAVLCCAEHDLDRQVAALAASRACVELVAVEEQVWDESSWVRQVLEEAEPAVTLCCSHGFDARAAAGVRRGVVVSDVPGFYWWALLERAEDDAPLAEPASV